MNVSMRIKKKRGGEKERERKGKTETQRGKIRPFQATKIKIEI